MVRHVLAKAPIQRNVTAAIDKMLGHWGIKRRGNHFSLNRSQNSKYLRWMPFPGSTKTNSSQARIAQMLSFMQACDHPLSKPLHDFLQARRMANYLKPNPDWSKAIGVVSPTKSSVQPPSSQEGKPKKKETSTYQTDPQQQPVRIQPNEPSLPRGLDISYVIPVKHSDGTIKPTTVDPRNYGAVQQLLAKYHSHPELKTVVTANQGCVRFFDRQLNKNTHFLSNTFIPQEKGSSRPIVVDGAYFPSVEHYFQHSKFVYALKDDADPNVVKRAKQEILKAQSGRDAAILGNPKGIYYRQLIDTKKWHQVSHQVMHRGIYAKFKYNPTLKAQLMATYPCVLIEQTPKGGDSFWGNGHDDSGLNLTGQIMAQVRDQILKEELTTKS
ncbi:NADAR family protein [Sansalvadorimonas verongulae]|nr:NADAR family protein [Sansalvadorimonas verongulae]